MVAFVIPKTIFKCKTYKVSKKICFTNDELTPGIKKARLFKQLKQNGASEFDVRTGCSYKSSHTEKVKGMFKKYFLSYKYLKQPRSH